MAGPDPLDPHTKDVAVPDYTADLTGNIRGVKLGVPTNYFNEDVQPAVAEAVAKAIKQMESRGAKTIPLAIPDLDGVLDCMLAIAMSEAAVYHQTSLRATPELFGDETRLLLRGWRNDACHYVHQRPTASNSGEGSLQTGPTRCPCSGNADTAFDRPEDRAVSIAYRHARRIGVRSVRAVLRSVQHFWTSCSLSSPRFLGAMPIGLQIIGKPFDEATVLRVADAFERNTEWHLKYPPIAGSYGLKELPPPPSRPAVIAVSSAC